MKVTNKLTLAAYNDYCLQELINKIPVPGHEDWLAHGRLHLF